MCGALVFIMHGGTPRLCIHELHEHSHGCYQLDIMHAFTDSKLTVTRFHTSSRICNAVCWRHSLQKHLGECRRASSELARPPVIRETAIFVALLLFKQTKNLKHSAGTDKTLHHLKRCFKLQDILLQKGGSSFLSPVVDLKHRAW